MPGFFDLFEGVVGGEHHAVVAERIDRAVQRLAEHMPEVATTMFSFTYSDGRLASLTA